MDSKLQQRVKVTVNNKPFLVEIDDLSASPITVKVNGQSYKVDIETVTAEKTPGPDSPAASDMPPPLAPPSVPKPPIAPASTNLDGASAKEIKAPMPGHIIDIAVKVGDEISAGQTLCLLEAMKMKNTIRAPRAGVIASVGVTPGQAVTYGDVLVTFE